MTPELTSDALLGLFALTLVHGTALALLTCVAEVTVLRRCRPSVKAAVWTVVLVKFLLPPVLPGSFGMSSLIGSLGLGAGNAVSVGPPSSASGPWDETKPSAGAQTFERAIFSDVSWPRLLQDRRNHLAGPLLLSYAVLLLFLTSKAVLHSRRAGRRVRRLPAAGDALIGEVCALARRLGLRRAPPVRLDAGAVSPYVIGAWSPTLVLPATMPARLDPPAREALIIHELAHIRRGDVLVRWLQNVARLVFFFWPPVWWLCRRIDRFSEMACDQWAVRLSSAGPRLYAESLLDVAKGVRAGALTAHELGFAARSSGLLRARFEMILGGAHESPPHLPRRASAVLLGWCLFALTGSVIASADNHARVAGNAVTSRAPATVTLEESATVGDTRAALKHADATRERTHERGRTEERARAAHRTETAGRAPGEGTPAKDVGDAASLETPVVRPAGAQGLRPEASPLTDLNGDGAVSDFEAGFSAGRRYAQRRRSDTATSCVLCEPCPDCDEAGRRREIELRARRLRRPDTELP